MPVKKQVVLAVENTVALHLKMKLVKKNCLTIHDAQGLLL